MWSFLKLISGLSVHPRYKRDVGYRLSRFDLAVAYEKEVEFQGPIVETVVYSNGIETVNINYTPVWNIELHNPNGFNIGNFCLGLL